MGNTLSRSLLPQEAYRDNDGVKSAEAHVMTAMQKRDDGESGHSGTSLCEHKFIVSGILQGLMTSALGLWTHAVISSRDASWAAPRQDLWLCGLLFGAAKAGETYVSVSYESAYYEHERNRETWEFQTNPDLEVEEYVNFVAPFGVTSESALMISNELAKFPEFFVQNHLVFELGLLCPLGYDHPISAAACSFGAHCFGMLLPCSIFEICRRTGHCSLTALAGGLFTLNFGVSRLTGLHLQTDVVQQRLDKVLCYLLLSAGTVIWGAHKLCIIRNA